MTTYSICNQRTATTIGRFEADSAAEAIKAAGGGDDLVATALDIQAPAACPFTLPLTVGTSVGRVPDQIFDARDQAVLILYGVDSRGAVDEARTMEWNQKGLERADYVVKAVNEYEGLVKRVAEMQLTLDAVQAVLDGDFDPEIGHARSVLRLKKRVAEMEELLGRAVDNAFANKLAGVMDRTLYETLTAKPVDRRKD